MSNNNYSDKVIYVSDSDTYCNLTKGDVYKVVGRDKDLVQIDIRFGLVWVEPKDIVEYNDYTKLLYTNKCSMEWS